MKGEPHLQSLASAFNHDKILQGQIHSAVTKTGTLLGFESQNGHKSLKEVLTEGFLNCTILATPLRGRRAGAYMSLQTAMMGLLSGCAVFFVFFLI